jgi:hypothetical protein
VFCNLFCSFCSPSVPVAAARPNLAPAEWDELGCPIEVMRVKGLDVLERVPVMVAIFGSSHPASAPDGGPANATGHYEIFAAADLVARVMSKVSSLATVAAVAGLYARGRASITAGRLGAGRYVAI